MTRPTCLTRRNGRRSAASRCGAAAWLLALLTAAAPMVAETPALPKSARFLGQPVPGLEPVQFAPGGVSTDAVELNAVFSPDGREFVFTRLIDGDAPAGYPGRTRPVMHHMVYEDGRFLFFSRRVGKRWAEVEGGNV